MSDGEGTKGLDDDMHIFTQKYVFHGQEHTTSAYLHKSKYILELFILYSRETNNYCFIREANNYYLSYY